MADKIFRQGNFVVFLNTTTGKRSAIPSKEITIIQSDEDVDFYKIYRNGDIINRAFTFAGWQDRLGVPYNEATFESFIHNHTGGGGVIDTFPQGEPAKFFFTAATDLLLATTMTVLGAIDDKTITVASATGIAVGNFFLIFDQTNGRVMQGHVTSINGLIIGVRDPLDFAYAIGSNVEFGEEDMSVNGLVTPVVYKYKNGLTVMPIVIHIISVTITIEMTTQPDFSKFGDIVGGILFGLSFRTVSPTKNVNFLNFRTNADFARLAGNYTDYPQKGAEPHSISVKLDLQDIGVVLVLEQEDDIEVTVQDDLSGLVKLTATFAGHRA